MVLVLLHSVDNRSILWGALLDIITNFFNICSTSNLRAKLYIEYSHCYFFLPNSIYICYVLPKSFLCSHTVWSTLRTVWYDAPRAGFSKIAPRPLLAIFTEAKNGYSKRYSTVREQTWVIFFFQWTTVLLAEARTIYFSVLTH